MRRGKYLHWGYIERWAWKVQLGGIYFAWRSSRPRTSQTWYRGGRFTNKYTAAVSTSRPRAHDGLRRTACTNRPASDTTGWQMR